MLPWARGLFLQLQVQDSYRRSDVRVFLLILLQTGWNLDHNIGSLIQEEEVLLY